MWLFVCTYLWGFRVKKFKNKVGDELAEVNLKVKEGR